MNGRGSSEALDARARLAETRRKRGHPEEALPVHREVLAAVVRMEGEDSTWVSMLRYQVAADLLAAGKPEDRAEAKALLDRALAVLEKQAPPHQRLAEVRGRGGRLKRSAEDRQPDSRYGRRSALTRNVAIWPRLFGFEGQ